MANHPPTPPILLLHSRDTVAVCLRTVAAGESVKVGDSLVVARQTVPAGHKLAILAHRAGQSVIKFGWSIGIAQTEIFPGEHVHSHNLESSHLPTDHPESKLPVGETDSWSNALAAAGSLISPSCSTDSLLSTVPTTAELTFQGFVRPNGKVGTRNYLAIISNVNCSASVARMIARRFDETILSDFPNVDGVISFRHESGCGMTWQGSRHRTLARVLAAMTRHPNVGGCLMVGLGCEQGSLDHLSQTEGLHQIHLSHGGLNSSQRTGQPEIRPIPMLSIQDSGGTQRTIEKGFAVVRDLLPEVNEARRSPVSASHLVLATECGGSDGYSGVTANPVLGAAADQLVACGGTVILSETTEIYGAEHLLANRARSAAVADRLFERLQWWQEHCSHYGERLDNNPSVGNKLGGLTTISEKSLGAIVKGGTTTLEAVYDYAQAVDKRGLVFMDTPGFDPASVTGMVAGGANLIAFTTGRGSCFGFKPVPCFKIASNTDLYTRLSDDMDFDAGPVIAGCSLQQMGQALLASLLAIASGQKTCSERHGIGDEEFVPWLTGPVL